MRPHTAIVYNGGAYGTYLHWVLTTLTQDIPIESPFTGVGNSHLFDGAVCTSMDVYRSRIQDHNKYDIVRLHPKTLKTESLTENLDFICDTADKVLYLYPDSDSMLLVINNYISKIRQDWWTNQFLDQISKEKIYSNWPVSADTPVNDIPDWIKREFLSFYLIPSWYDQVEWFHPTTYSNNNCQIIFVSDLLNNFEHTVQQAVTFLGVATTRTVSALTDLHHTNLLLQQYKNQDNLCQKIVDCVKMDFDFSWQELTLPLASQAYIQWQLRNNGFEIHCDGLDYFPNNSVQLKSLLYHPNT